MPVPHLNVLVPAWLQFMVHDWLSHGGGRYDAPPHGLPLPPGDDWPSPDHDDPADLAGRSDGPRKRGSPPPTAIPRRTGGTVRRSTVPVSSGSKWCASRSGDRPVASRRQDRISMHEGHLPIDPGSDVRDLELAGVNGNWWIGLSVLHTLFAREHNSIVDRLRVDYPAAAGEWLFQKARLVNAALMAKIHTVEWTPALMNSPAGRFAMRGNYWGMLGEQYARAYGRVGSGEILSGIPGSVTDHHSAPYAMTEEFTAVYRMHSLLPDELSFRRHHDDAEIIETRLHAVTGGRCASSMARCPSPMRSIRWRPAIPAHWSLHNYPNSMRRLPKKEGLFLDIAATDVLRDRERGVPRYCAFRRHLGMRVPEELRRADPRSGLAARARRRLQVGRPGGPPGRNALRDAARRVSDFPIPHSASSFCWRRGVSRATASSPPIFGPRSIPRRASPGYATTVFPRCWSVICRSCARATPMCATSSFPGRDEEVGR